MQTISLASAILININIMLGAGLFINTTELAHRAGALGWLAYGIVGILMLPLILSIAQLVRIYPQGAFYTYGSQVFNPFIGYISTWVYFTSKLASATLTMHAAATLIHALVPTLHGVPPIAITTTIIGVFGLLNTLNIRTGSAIQKVFIGAKIIPLTFVLLAGCVWFSAENSASLHMLWQGLPSCIPLVMFAFLGFEAACSLSSKIDNPEKNAPKAIVYSFLAVVSIYCAYQSVAYGIMGSEMQGLHGYQDFFASLAAMLSPIMYTKLMGLLYCAIAASTLGGAYGILYSNMWNLHTLAHHNHSIFPTFFTRVNAHAIPVGCVLAEVLICLIYLYASGGSALSLQQIAAMGCSLTYFISVCALVRLKATRDIDFSWAIALSGFLSCFMLAGACVMYVLRGAHPSLFVFGGLLILGIGMYAISKK